MDEWMKPSNIMATDHRVPTLSSCSRKKLIKDAKKDKTSFILRGLHPDQKMRCTHLKHSTTLWEMSQVTMWLVANPTSTMGKALLSTHDKRKTCLHLSPQLISLCLHTVHKVLRSPHFSETRNWKGAKGPLFGDRLEKLIPLWECRGLMQLPMLEHSNLCFSVT
jgi:hypothetical protein